MCKSKFFPLIIYIIWLQVSTFVANMFLLLTQVNGEKRVCINRVIQKAWNFNNTIPSEAPASVGGIDRVYASPMAKKLAEQRNIRLQGKGTGLFGGITSSDIGAQGRKNLPLVDRKCEFCFEFV